jgi:4-hydroxyacetophenone monooxygenase
MTEPIKKLGEHDSVAEARVRDELLGASDATIEDATSLGDPMVLRGLIYQLTGDPEIAATTPVSGGGTGLLAGMTLGEEDAALVRRKAAELLKSYRDSGAGELGIGPTNRLPASMALTMGTEPFSVTIIGAGMGGLNAAIQLKRAGIPFSVIEKNDGVGGTWYENRYPGARVDTPSRLYTHVFGVDYSYPYGFCPWTENQKYFDWVADTFNVRGDITFETEVRSLAWDEAASMWDITVDGPEGRRTLRSNAVITAVGFLNRPNMPDIPGMERFNGPSWHTARWPADFDPTGKRVAVIGTGCTGYQMVPELALEAEHVTVFQRTPQWLFPAPGYRSPFPSQVTWLDRNLPYHTNFMRLRIASGFIAGFGPIAQVDPHFHDEHAVSRINKAARDDCIAFLKEKLGDADLIEKMTPEHPVLSARPVLVDPSYSILDAIQRDDVTLVVDGIRGITETGVETEDGRVHEVDAIVYATGFRATEYLFPMSITGRGGKTVEQLWSQTGAQGYVGAMIPGCPNMWTLYGPNTNGCIERLILDDKKSIDVKEEPYRRYNEMIDERNRCMAWSDPRAQNYYWTNFGRSATQNPLTPLEMWNLLREPDFADLDVR